MFLRSVIHVIRCTIPVLLSICLYAQTNVITQHNDIGRTGLNSTETVLTPANVGSGAFGKLYTVPLDGLAMAQPLYVSQLSINGTQRSVVFVATEHDSVYALDAGASGQVLWQASLLDAAHGAAPGATSVPVSNTGCPNVVGPEYGITGTPVIDLATGTLYVVSKTLEGANPYPVQRIHALDITTGAEKFNAPVTISATVSGYGNGSVGGQLSFDPMWENQRAGLLFVNNTVYIGWASHCDISPWHGWLMGYSAASGTLQQTQLFVTTPNGIGSGIWQSGIGLAADQDGVGGSARLFVPTGNGDYDGKTEWGESLLNLAATNLTVTDSFTAYNTEALNTADYDIASAGTLLLPDEAGTAAHPHLALQLSKAGVMYLVDRDHLGGYNPSADQVLQEESFAQEGYGLWGGPAYFNGNIYMWPANANMVQYSLTNGALSSAPVAVNPYQEPGNNTGYYVGTFLGATPSISANGDRNGIVWVNDFITDQTTPTQVLFAFDASNVANTIWSSPRYSATDSAGAAQKFGVPTIADGRVYLAGANVLNVFGILPAPLVSITVTPNSTAMAAGATQQFIATGVYGDSSTQDLTSIVTWTSSSAAATIAATGLATGVAEGSTTITASLGNLTSAPVPLYVNGVFPGTNIGSAGTAQNVYFTFASTTNLAATPWVVLTEGVPSLDFQAAAVQPANVCQTGHTYNAGDVCVVSVIFNPTTPGLRKGAVQLVAVGNSTAGTSYISGAAVGAALALTPGIINTVAGNGTHGYTGDNGQATGAEMSAPTGVAMDGAGNLYIADSQNNCIRKVSSDGMITTVAGTGMAAYSGDNGPAMNAALNGPRGVALDGAGNLYISDTNNNVVREVSTSGIITTIAGTGTLGYIGYGGPATAAQLASPYGLVVDGGGNLYIADSGNSIVRKVTPSGVITTVAGVGFSGYSGDGASAIAAQLAFAEGLAVDKAGNLYIADTGNNVVREVNTNGIITTIAGNGTSGYAGDGGPAAGAQLASPIGLAVDIAGNLYIADTANAAIREIDTTGNIFTVAGYGLAGYTGDGSVAIFANLNGPTGIAVSTLGNLYFADSGNNVVRSVNVGSSALALAPVAAGQVGSPVSFLASNVGDAPLNFSAFNISSNFEIVGGTNSCAVGTPVMPGASCLLEVEFAPTTNSSPITGALTVTDNAPLSPQTISLSGSGVGATTINTSPSGLQVSIDGKAAQTAPIIVAWEAGSKHTITVPSPQAATGTRYIFTSWSDGTTAATDSITVTANTASYTANFSTYYLLSTFVSPGDYGVLTPSAPSPSGDAYYPANTQLTLTATASSSANPFSNWTGSVSGSSNPLSITMSAPISETGNFASNPGAGSIPALAYEPFGETSGTLLTGASGSGDLGWAAPWVEESGEIEEPGYETASSNPLTYPGLATTTNYAIGGFGYQSVGRQLDVTSTGPFSGYLANGLIGAPGQTIWLSFLMREDADPSNGQVNAVFLTPYGGTNAWTPSAGIGFGYFGTSPYWGLQGKDGTSVLSSVPVVQGQTVFMVASITFGATNQVNLYINPTSLGGSAPATPTLQLATSASLAFQSLSYLGGYQPGVSSLADIRLGGTYGMVTPTKPSAPTSQTITFTAPTSPVTYPVAPISLSATASSGLAVTFSVISGPGTISGNTLTVTGTGTIVVAANQAGNSSYAAAPQVTQSVVVTSLTAQTITFPAPTSPVTYPVAPISLSATASSGLAVTFSVISGPGTINGNTLTVTGTGTIMVAANQAGNSSFAAAPQVTQSVVVTGVTAQTITFAAPTSPVTYPVAPITLSATATSGLAVTFSVISGPGTINGNTLTVTGTGTIMIAANQAGNSSFAAAPQVTQSVVVNAAVVVSGTVFAYEPFAEAAGIPLSGAAGGGDSGWAAPWIEQFNETVEPGYQTASATPLTYPGLVTTSDYAVGGFSYQSAGRQLNVTSVGPFSDYLANGLIGASGQTIWLSFLLREDASPGNGQVNAVFLNSNSVAPWALQSGVGIGYFGTSPYWGLQVNNGTPVLSSVPVVQGQSVLMVASITFGATNQVNLYINPTSLGGSAPAAPSLQPSTAANIAFQSLSYLGGYQPGVSSLADIRFGSSYAAVTPTTTVTQASQTITFTAPTSPVSYPVAPITLSATASSGLAVTFSVVSGPGTINGNTLTVTGTGTILVAANQAGNSSFAAAPQVTQSVVVSSLTAQTITFRAPTSPVTYPVAPISLSATASSGLAVTFSVVSGPGTINGNTLTVTGAGTIMVAANQSGNGSYAAAPQVTQSIVVTSLTAQTITFPAPTSPVTYPVASITLSATASSGLAVTFSVLSGPGTINGNTLTVTGTGTIMIAANQAGNSSYAAAPQVTQSIVVSSLTAQTITFPAPTSPVTYPVAPITLSATASSGLAVSFSVISGPGTISGNTLTVTGTGTILIAANQAGNSSYAAAPQVTQSIVVTSLTAQTITFPAPTSPVTYPVAPISLSATASSGLAVTFSVVSGPGTISGNTLTVTGTGTIMIAANQAGNSSFAAAPQVTQSIVVTSLTAQTITFPAPTSPVTYPVAPISLSATASSGLAVTFSVISGPGTISGNMLTVTGTGTIMVAANQAGNSSYAAAPQVTQSIVVNAAVVVSGTVFAYEPFAEAAGIPLSGAAGGGDSGWAAPWIEQFNETTEPGYQTASATPLTYQGLVTTSDYAVGGFNYQSAGRQLNVTSAGPFSDYLANGLIGASGQTIWLSFLLREDASPGNGQVNAVFLNSNSAAPWVLQSGIGVGYFGTSPYWGLQVSNGAPVLSSVPVVQGQSVLMVASITFGATNQVNLYINPTSLGGSAPATPSLQLSTAANIAFQSLSYLGGYQPGVSSLADIRFGSSYAAVTPTTTATQASQTITFTAPTSPVSYPVAPITLSATASSGLAVTLSVVSGPGTISGNTLTVTGTGTILVAANQAGNSSFAAAPQVTQSIVVTSLTAQTISFQAPTSPVSYPVAPITLSATASSGLAVTFSVISGPGTISGNTLTVTGTGTIMIAANQAGNSSYAAAPQVTQSVVATGVTTQTITFPAPTSPVSYPVAPITLSATASSGLAVAFSVISGPGTISGNTLTVTGTGTIMVAANQAGNSSYAAAPQVTQSIVVSSLTAQTITFPAPTSPVSYPVAPITLSATASSGLAVTFSVISGPGTISGNMLTVTGTGTIMIAANQTGNSSFAAAPQVTQSIVVNAAVVASGTVFAFEPFAEAAGIPLSSAAGGGDSGWAAPWIEQFNETTEPGYQTASATPLTYPGLVTTSDYAVGGFNYQSAGRQLNVTSAGPFSDYLANGLIGASGQTIWLSFLLREDASPGNGQVNAVFLNSNSVAPWALQSGVGIGYFGTSPYWGLQVSNGTPVLSSVPVVQGQSVLMVASITFGATNQVSLYINPTSLGGSAPAAPTLQLATSASLAFQSLSYLGGYQPGVSSLADIRFGSSYAAVTPTTTSK